MLKTENRNNGKDALEAFYAQKNISEENEKEYNWHFEHGQLWITHIDGKIWSVVDAVGGNSVDGFDFEEVS